MNNGNKILTHKIDIHEKDVLREAFPAATNRQIKRIIELNINPYILEYYTGQEIKLFYREEVEKVSTNSLIKNKPIYENVEKVNNFINDKIYFRIGRVWIKNNGKYDGDGEIVYIGPNGEFTFNGIIQCKLVDKNNASTIYDTSSGKNSETSSGTNSETNSGINIHYVSANINKTVSSGIGSNSNELRFDINKEQFIYDTNLKYFFHSEKKSFLYLKEADIYFKKLKKINNTTNESKYSDILEKHQILELLFAIDYKNQLVINEYENPPI